MKNPPHSFGWTPWDITPARFKGPWTVSAPCSHIVQAAWNKWRRRHSPAPRPALTGGTSVYALEQLFPFWLRAPQCLFVCVPASLGPAVVKEQGLIRMMAPVIKLIRGALWSAVRQSDIGRPCHLDSAAAFNDGASVTCNLLECWHLRLLWGGKFYPFLFQMLTLGLAPCWIVSSKATTSADHVIITAALLKTNF